MSSFARDPGIHKETRVAQVLRVLFAVGCACLAACNDVVTVDAVITESGAIADDRILGDWRAVGGDEYAHVVRGQGKDYRVTYRNKEDTVEAWVRLGKIGAVLAIDVYPGRDSWKAMDGLPTHSVYAIDLYGDSIAVRGFNIDSVLTRLATGQIRVPYSTVEDNVVLHGEPTGMRAAMAQLIGQSALLNDRAVYRRER
jgi:hypothetical protein